MLGISYGFDGYEGRGEAITLSLDPFIIPRQTRMPALFQRRGRIVITPDLIPKIY